MIDIQKRLNDLNIQFELIGEIRDGETSKTYLGKFENKKAIFKLFNLKNLNMKTNGYLDLKITNQLIENNLFPKIFYLSTFSAKRFQFYYLLMILYPYKYLLP